MNNKKITALVILILIAITTSNAYSDNNKENIGKKFYLIYDLYKQKKYGELITQINSNDERIPFLSDYYLYFEARAYQELNNGEKSLKKFNEIIKRFPASALYSSALYNSGKILMLQGKTKEAAPILKKAASLTNYIEDRGGRLFTYAKALEETRQFNESILVYNEIRLNYPATQYSKEAFKRVDDLRKKKSVKSPDSDSELLWDEAEILLKERKYNEAQKAFELVYKKFPAFPLAEKANIRQALTFKTLKDEKNYQKKLEFIVSHSKKKGIIAEALYLLAQKAWNKNQHEEAKEYIVRLIDEFENSAFTDKAYYMLGRIHEEEGNFTAASKTYEELARYYPESSFLNEALFRKGFSLYKAKKYIEAVNVLAKIKNDGNSFYEAALYWQAKAYLKLDNTKDAARKLNEIVLSGKQGYYTFIARQLLKNYKNSVFTPIFDTVISFEKITNTKPSSEQALKYLTAPKILNQNEISHLEKYIAFKKLRIKEFAEIELKELKRIARLTQGVTSSLAVLFYNEGDYQTAITLARKGISSSHANNGIKDEIPFISYPLPFEPQLSSLCESYKIHPLLVTSLILQESIFNSSIVSRAGAVGLMQIMPETGRILSTKLKVSYSSGRLYEPELNLKLGIYYLSDLLKMYDNNIIKALSAYNAGEKAVDRWTKRFPNKETDEFVEDIPYRETRNYVKLVLRNFEIYRDIYK